MKIKKLRAVSVMCALAIMQVYGAERAPVFLPPEIKMIIFYRLIDSSESFDQALENLKNYIDAHPDLQLSKRELGNIIIQLAHRWNNDEIPETAWVVQGLASPYSRIKPSPPVQRLATLAKEWMADYNNLTDAVDTGNFQVAEQLMKVGIPLNKTYLYRWIQDPNKINLFIRAGYQPELINNYKKFYVLRDLIGSIEENDPEYDAKIDKITGILNTGVDFAKIPLYAHSPILTAMRKGNPHVLALVIGKDINKPIGNSGKTPLMFAASDKWSIKTQVLEQLIALGADINAQDKAGNTALMHAILAGAGQAMSVLLQQGADLTIRNKEGQTALGVAESIGGTHYAQVLREAGAEL